MTITPNHRSRILCATALLAFASVSCEAVLPAMRVLSAAFSNYDPRVEKYASLYEDLTTALRKESPGAATTAAEADATGSGAPPIELDVALLRQRDVDGVVVPESMQDGDVLHFRGTAAESDRFQVFMRPQRTCFVYVLNVDSTGWVTPLYPSLEERGRLTTAGEEVFLPGVDDTGAELAYAVDGHRGIETFYFLASTERRMDIEALMRRFDTLERPQLGAEVASVERLEPDEELILRGAARRDVSRKASVRTADGPVEFDTETFLQQAGAALVVTRWFHHR